MNAVIPSVDPFGEERQQEATAVLRFLETAAQRAFQGTLVLSAMPPVLVGSTTDMLGAAYRSSIVRACVHWGALPVLAHLNPALPAEALPFDKVQVIATITEDLEGLTTPAGVMEACAEVLRVLLAGPIIAAKDDLAQDDEVQVHFRVEPTFLVTPDMDENVIYVAGRMRAAVIRKAEPGKSYLLGGGKSMDIELPDARMFAGPNRLRFLDQRSPGHLVHEELVRVTA